MLIKTYDITVMRRKNQKSKPAPVIHKVGVFTCDQCSVQFEIEHNLTNKLKHVNHFCSRKCQGTARRPGGCLNYVYDKFESAFKRPEIRKKIQLTMIKRYGSAFTLSSNILRKKVNSTMQNRYGGLSYLSSPERRKLINWNEVARKRHQTMKINGSYAVSHEENSFYEYLQKRFCDVDRCILVNNKKWPIDFYVKNLDLYVQFDGVYWHGLDRPIETIAEYRTKRDVIIHKKWLTDRAQDVWFASNGLKLLRIPSTWFNRKTFTCLLLDDVVGVFSLTRQRQSLDQQLASRLSP